MTQNTVHVVPPTAGGDYLVWAAPDGYQAAAFLPSAPAAPYVVTADEVDRFGRQVRHVRLLDGDTLLAHERWVMRQAHAKA
jgi:hypothetical protein